MDFLLEMYFAAVYTTAIYVKWNDREEKEDMFFHFIISSNLPCLHTAV